MARETTPQSDLPLQAREHRGFRLQNARDNSHDGLYNDDELGGGDDGGGDDYQGGAVAKIRDPTDFLHILGD